MSHISFNNDDQKKIYKKIVSKLFFFIKRYESEEK